VDRVRDPRRRRIDAEVDAMVAKYVERPPYEFFALRLRHERAPRRMTRQEVAPLSAIVVDRKRRLVAARRVVIEERERRERRAKLAVNRGIDEILRYADRKRLVAKRDVVVSQHSS